MNNQIKKASFLVLIIGVAAFLSLILMLIMAGDSPKPAVYPNKPGFSTAIIWFELAESADEIFQILGESESEAGRHIRRVMDITNQYDFIFMIFYSALFASLFILLRYLKPVNGNRVFSGKNLMFIGLLLSIAMLAGDVMENIQLLKLTGIHSISEVDADIIFSLKLWTRVKWSSIFLACILLAAYYINYSRISGGLIAIIYAAVAISGFISIASYNARYFLEFSGNLLGVAWLLSIIHGGIIFFRCNNNTSPDVRK